MRSVKNNLKAQVIAFYILAGSCALVAAADLTVQVSGQARGDIYIGLYDREESWEARQPMKGDFGPYTDGYSATFEALPAGRYGIRLYVDENGNKILDTNMIGIPSEPYGISRNAKGRMGPPRFEDAALDLSENTTIKIDLR